MTNFQVKVVNEVNDAISGIRTVDDCYCHIDAVHYVWAVANGYLKRNAIMDRYLSRGTFYYSGRAEFKFGGKRDELNGKYRVEFFTYNDDEWHSLTVTFDGLCFLLKDYVN